MNGSSILSIITVLAGCGLEYYAYMLFTVMAPIIAPIFNGGGDSHASLASTYLVVFLAALVRPIGGLVIGYIGDKKGRNVALFWAMMIMSASSFAITLLPTYAQIGAWCGMFLLVCRMMQTMSAAGELNGAAIFLIETLADLRKRSTKGLASGLAWCFTVFGMFGASVASYHCNSENWRIPFFIGGFIGLFAILLRLMPKANHGSAPAAKKPANFNFVRSVTASILVAAGISGMFYYNMVFMIGYLQLHMDPLTVRQYGMYYYLTYALVLLFAGILSDYVKKTYRTMMAACIMMAILAVPTIYMRDLTFNIINVVLLAFYVGPSHAILFQLFPREYRYRGVSTAYSIGTSIVGGATPFVCTYFARTYFYFPSAWLIFVAMLGLLGIALGRKSLRAD